VELQLVQEQYVRIVITEDIMSVVALIVIVQKMVTECYKVESIFFTFYRTYVKLYFLQKTITLN
jgi:hypothetical protein